MSAKERIVVCSGTVKPNYRVPDRQTAPPAVLLLSSLCGGSCSTGLISQNYLYLLEKWDIFPADPVGIPIPRSIMQPSPILLNIISFYE